MKTNRRTFLRGSAGALGAISLAFPLLPSLTNASDPDFPTRLVVFFSGNGTIRNSWLPSASDGRITSMSRILAPLERHLPKLAVVDGMLTAAAQAEYQPKRGFHGHERGIGAVLTGMPLNLGDMVEGSGYAQGISVDNYIANLLGDESALGNLSVGLMTRRHGNGDYNRDTMSYLGDGDPRFMESDGSILFSRIFGELSGDRDAYQRITDRRQSVLDFVRGDLRRLESRISSEDRLRLAKHQEAFRNLERQLAEPPPVCEEPTLTAPDRWDNANNFDQIVDFQLSQTVKALECDRTRVVSMQFGKGLGTVPLRVMDRGVSESWHSASHQDYPAWEDHMVGMNTFIAETFASLLDRMDAVREGSGTLLDHSVVLWVNEHGDANVHRYDNIPVVIAGGGHDFFKTGGQLINVGGQTNNDLLISLCHAFGATDVSEFGLRELCTGPMSALHT